MTTEKTKAVAIVQDNSSLEGYFDTARFEHSQRVAALLASANLVPKHYQNSTADCFIALNQAALMQIDPMLFMQKTYVIGGKIGLETQLALALTKKAGVFIDVIQYKFTGKEKADNWTCTAFATTQAGTLCDETCSVQDAKDMGWWTKNPQLWQNQTKKALRYRSAMNLIRLYCPEVLFGLDSKEELIDFEATQAPTRDITSEVNEIKQKSKSSAVPNITVNAEKTPTETKQEPPTPEAQHESVRDLEELYRDPAHKADFDALIQKGKYGRARIEHVISSNNADSAALILAEIDKIIG